MDMITVSAKTMDEAITKALLELRTTSEHLYYEIVQKESSGFLGIFGGKPCVIRARVMGEEEEKERKRQQAEKEKAAKLAAEKEKAEAEKAAKAKAAAEKAAKEEAEKKAKKQEEKPAKAASEKPAKKTAEATDGAAKADKPAKAEKADKGDKPERTEKPERSEDRPSRRKTAAGIPTGDGTIGRTHPAGKTGRRNRSR